MNDYILKNAKINEESWCNMMNYKNPYLDPYDHHITDLAVTTDSEAYRSFPDNNHIYDKLFVAKTQKLKCGPLQQLYNNEDSVKYPIFIKPRYGHLSGGSKLCIKIIESH